MKFIYLNDSHIKGKNPSYRIGNYYEDCMAKIREVISIAKEKKCDYIFHGGDLYDSNNVSNVMMDELVDLIEESNIPWYVTWGNHDQRFHNTELSNSTTLAHIFRRCKMINHLELMLDKEKDIHVEGFDYYHNIEEALKKDGLMSSGSNCSWKIAIVHSFISLKPFLPQVMHIQAKDIKTDFDVVLCAHFHNYWGVEEVNGAKYVNLGAFGRTGIGESDKMPKCLFVDSETKALEIIDLKSAKKGEEVFDLEKVKKIKSFDTDIDEFVKSLESTEFQGLNLRGVVENIGKEKNVNPTIIKEIIDRIGEIE